MERYKPLHVTLLDVCGLRCALDAMRLPKRSRGDTTCAHIAQETLGPRDARLARSLILAGDSHAKAIRGIVAYLEITMQVGFLIEFETYRHGVECLSTTSSMHNELRQLSGVALAEQKQQDLPEKQYTRIVMMSYQVLRRIYRERRHHRHPDWQLFCDFIESLPFCNLLILPLEQKVNSEQGQQIISAPLASLC